jgi:Leucine-rich repeat (LRR) protein
VDGCEALEFIDCAENDIELLVLKNLSNLKTVSARENNLNKLILKGLKNLEYLDSNIQVNNGKLEIRFNGEFNSFETFYYDEDTNFFFNNKQVEKEKL